MKQIFQYACRTSIVAAALVALPAWGQLGLGGAGGAVSTTVSGTTRAAISEPAAVTAPVGSIAGRQDVFSSLNATQNAVLSTQLSPLLPETTSVPAAAAGFHDDSAFLTTLHAAHNLNIPFEQLKAETTGRNSTSLNTAIRKLRPDLDSKAAKDGVSLAQRQSERDIARAQAAGTKDHVASRVTSDERLAAQVNPLVPKGQSLGDAAAGFKTEDQFLSTLHAANDNGIAFGDLKDRVTAGQSLSTAIHEMKPSMDANASASAAAQADAKAKNDKVRASASAQAQVSSN